ncbi:MAG TPA: ABC transporter permease, partial [bacterium]|nr:ABC transporter permease [bacterium]
MKQKPKRFECLLSAPSFVWLIVFFIIPLIIILAISFRNADHFGGIGENWVLTNFQKIIES